MRAYLPKFTLIALVAVLVSSVLTACGSDTEITGPNAIGNLKGNTNDAISSLDGASGSDATSIGADVGTVGPDGGTSTGGPDATIIVPPDQSCAGKCGKYNPNWNCQCDTICFQNNNCCADIQQVCPAVGPTNKCGDGQCTGNETAKNCPQDCTTGGGGGVDPVAVKTCLESACPGEWATCAGDKDCASVLDCAASCTTNACLNKCAQGAANPMSLNKTLVPLLKCGQQGNCYGGGTTTPGSVCGDGQCTAPETAKSCPKDCGTTTTGSCGDGQCTAPENAKNCPQDCGGGGTINPGQIVTCLEKDCANEYAACAADASCAKVLDCAKACTSMNCVQGCATGGGMGGFSQALIGVATCGQQSGCFSGGGTTPPSPVCGDGQCTAPENAKSCPQDCATVPPTSKCGDGTCDKTTETSVNCPADCKPTQAGLCTEKACPNEYNACGQTAACFAAVNCVANGGSVQQCLTDMTIAKQATSLLMCAQQAGCFGGGTTTNNSCQGQCGAPPAPGQTCGCSAMCAQMGNCCADYKQYCGNVTPPVQCGNGVCEPGETGQTCPQDCGPPKPVCGDGICDPNTESSATCPADCGTPPQAACKSKADCAADEVCCIQSAGQVCVKIGTCN